MFFSMFYNDISGCIYQPEDDQSISLKNTFFPFLIFFFKTTIFNQSIQNTEFGVLNVMFF